MGNFTDRLMGEVIEDPDGQQRDVEYLLNKLLEALRAESEGSIPTSPTESREAQ